MPTYLVKIGSTEVYRIRKYSVSLPKLNASADRNMRGNLKIAHLGTFPKITLTFRPMTEPELAAIGALIGDSEFTVQWWNPISRSYKSGTFYAGDSNFDLLVKDDGLYDSFTVALVAFNAMT